MLSSGKHPCRFLFTRPTSRLISCIRSAIFMVFIEVSDSMPVLILKDVMVLTSSMISKYILSKDVKQLSILILYIIAHRAGFSMNRHFITTNGIFRGKRLPCRPGVQPYGHAKSKCQPIQLYFALTRQPLQFSFYS